MPPLLFSIALNGYDRVYRDCLQSQARYSDRHGYRFWLVDAVPWRLTASQCAWLKVEIMRGLLDAGAPYVAFFDADCEIRDHAPPFHLEFSSSKSLLLAPGKSGRVNSGVIFASNSEPSSARFLEGLISNAHVPIPRPDATRYENGHFIHFGKSFSGLGLLEHQAWNNNSQYDESSYVQHYSDGKLREIYRARPVSARYRLALRAHGYKRALLNRSRPSLEGLGVAEFILVARDHFTQQYGKRIR